jgi:hypothetical protein
LGVVRAVCSKRSGTDFLVEYSGLGETFLAIDFFVGAISINSMGTAD